MKIQPQPPKQQLMDVTAAEEQRAAKARKKGQIKPLIEAPVSRDSETTANIRASIASQNRVAARSAPSNLAQAEKALSKVVKGVQAQPQAVRSTHQRINRESILTLLKH